MVTSVTNFVKLALSLVSISNNIIDINSYAVSSDEVSGLIADSTEIKVSYLNTSNVTGSKNDLNYYIGFNTSSATKTYTCPKASDLNDGWYVYIGDDTGNAPTYAITISKEGTTSDTINGSSSYTISNAYGTVKLMKLASGKFKAISKY